MSSVVQDPYVFKIKVKKISRHQLQHSRLSKRRCSHSQLNTNSEDDHCINSQNKPCSSVSPNRRIRSESTLIRKKNPVMVSNVSDNQSADKETNFTLSIPLSTFLDDSRSTLSNTDNHLQFESGNLSIDTLNASVLTKIDRQQQPKPHTIDISLNKHISLHEDVIEKKMKKKRRRRKCFGWYCCPLCLFGCILLGTVLAAIILALSLNSKTTISTTTVIATITTITVTSTTISTTVTTTTTSTTPVVYSLTSTNETIFGIWNATAGGDSSSSVVGGDVGNYYNGEIPNYAFDNNYNTKYTNFGYCNESASAYRQCGINTGFYVTLQQGATLIRAIQFCTGNDQAPRDPLTVTVEGSNQTSSLVLGSSWTLIFNGSSGLDTNPGRRACGIIQYFISNSIAYLSYRILITSQRSFDEAVQYSEVKLLG